MEPISGRVDRAQNLLRTAEEGVRALIAQSLAAQRYDEVAALAVIARRLVAQSGELALPASLNSEANGNHVELTHSDALAGEQFEMRQGATRQPAARQYPHFEREGNRLVKIGWSKKDRRVYEHKTSFTAVSAVCEALRKQHGRFIVDQVLPIKDGEGSDVPSYQAYLVLAWLRKEGLVERNGNDGYTASTNGLSSEQIAKRFDSLPTR